MPRLWPWKGLYTNASAHDLPPGAAQVQTNLTLLKPGVLETRKGIALLTTTSGHDYMPSLYKLRLAGKDQLVYQNGTTAYLYDGTSHTAIETGLSLTYPAMFAQTQEGNIIRMDGQKRAAIRMGTTNWKHGITAPAAAPTASASSGAGSGFSEADYWVGYRYKDAAGRVSDMSPTAKITTGDSGEPGDYGFTIGVVASAETDVSEGSTRVTAIEVYRSLADDPSVMYLVATVANSSLSVEEGTSDEAMLDLEYVPLLYDDGSLCARRHGVLPTNVRHCIPFQNRYFYFGQATVDDTLRNVVYYSEVNLPESVPTSQNTLKLTDDLRDGDELVGGFAHAQGAFLLQRRHTWRLTFSQTPRLDGTCLVAKSRGALHNRAYAFYRDTVYLLDEMGPWRMGDDGEDEFDQPVHNYWYDDLIDHTKSSTFHVAVEPHEQVVRYFVVLAGETDIWRQDYPSTALCYSIKTGAWWLERYGRVYTASSTYTYEGRVRTILASTTSLLIQSEGYEDQDADGTPIPIEYAYKTGMVSLESQENDEGKKAPIPRRTIWLEYKPLDSGDDTDTQQVRLKWYLDHNTAGQTIHGGHQGARVSATHGSEGVVADMRYRPDLFTAALGSVHASIEVRGDGRQEVRRSITIEFSGQQDTALHTFYDLRIDP